MEQQIWAIRQVQAAGLVVRGRLLVRATGTVAGKIAYGEIEIERGGTISGEISDHTDGAVSHLKPV
jgi:cytoskeletal protein CcmA (bactofilin family)